MTRSTRQIPWLGAMLVVATVGTAPVAAQSHPQPRVEISANAGVVSGVSGFQVSESFPSNGGELETLTVNHSAKTPVDFNAGGAVRIAPQLWVGVQFAMADMKTNASVSASVPHPLLFNAPRNVQGTANDLAHNEQNIHVDLMYALPVGGADVRIMAGPTFFNLKQDFVSGVNVNETYPFDTATFASATTKQLSGSAVGFNAGVDISYLFTPRVGVGGLVRYGKADVKFNDATIGQQTVKAGGLEVAAGVRVRF
jgi:hypothetical protein